MSSFVGMSGHGRLFPRLWVFQALLRGGMLAFERAWGGLNTLHESRKMHLELGCWGQMEWPTSGWVGYITHAVPGGGGSQRLKWVG